MIKAASTSAAKPLHSLIVLPVEVLACSSAGVSRVAERETVRVTEVGVAVAWGWVSGFLLPAFFNSFCLSASLKSEAFLICLAISDVS